MSTEEFIQRSIEIDNCNGEYRFAKNNKKINNNQLKRIHKLGIPPAYTKLWLAKKKDENIQVVALDSKKRKQYFYSPQWVAQRTNEKFQRMYNFLKTLKILQNALNRDIKSTKMSKQKTMAYMIKITEHTNIRIGNKKYLDQNESFGLSTLKKEHIHFINPSKVLLSFKGKHNVQQNIIIKEKSIITFLHKMYSLPTEWMMKYQGQDGKWYRVSAQDLNNYLHSIVGKEFTIKDFRTHGANKTFLNTLQQCGIPSGSASVKKNISHALEETAQKLGNNKATSKKSYVMDYIIEEYKRHPEWIVNNDITSIMKKACK